MDDETLVLLGRIAVGWGQITFEIDHILFKLLGASVEAFKEYPTVSLKRKLGDLDRELSKPERAKQRPLLLKVHKAVGDLASDRNVIFHGLWGICLNSSLGEWTTISRSYTRETPFALKDLSAFHERLIAAAEIIDAAFYNLVVGGDVPAVRNRRQFWADGPPSAGDPPPPAVIHR